MAAPQHSSTEPPLGHNSPSDSLPRIADRPAWLLRWADQATVAVCVLLGLLSTIAWWALRGGLRGELVELERAEWQTARFQVDINSADWPELIQLPQIGESLANRILESRQTEGPFRDHRDLMRVKGIGPKTLNLIRPYLRPMPDQETLAPK